VVPENLDEGKGVRVAELVDDGPAAAVASRPVTSSSLSTTRKSTTPTNCTISWRTTEPGEKLAVRVLRDGEKQEFTLELAETPGKVNLAELSCPAIRATLGAPVLRIPRRPPAADAPELEAEREGHGADEAGADELKAELQKLRAELEKKK